MSKKTDRSAWERDEEAPVPYRLPSSHKTAPAGCWSTALLLLLLALLALALLGCRITDVIQKATEPAERSVCRFKCRQAGMGFGSYTYEIDTCVCLDADGSEIKLYGIDLEEVSQ